MYKMMQSGRSMVEMLGVLAIIGVLSVGGLATINDAQQKRKVAQLVSDISQLSAVAKKLSCQYDSAYSTYTNFLNKSEAIPSHLTYNSSTKKIEGVMDTNIEIKGVTGNTSLAGDATLKREYFVVEVTGLSESACMKLATTDWGRKNTNGCIGVSVGTGDVRADCLYNGDSCESNANVVYERSSDATYPMSLAKAQEQCGDDGTVKVWFKACH